MQTLENKVAYITGGSKGIGFGIAERLMAEGMRVAITSRSLERAQKAADSLGGNSGNVLPIASDVTNFKDEQHAVEKVLDQWGSLDVVIANAGVGHFASVEEISTEQWNRVIDTNLTGVFHTVKASIPALKRSKGYIITIASLAGTNFFAGGSVYNASKFGLVGFTQAIMLDLRYEGINTTTIMPGSVASHFHNRPPTNQDDWKIQPEDIGQLVAELLKMPPRTLPSKIEVRPSIPPRK